MRQISCCKNPQTGLKTHKVNPILSRSRIGQYMYFNIV